MNPRMLVSRDRNGIVDIGSECDVGYDRLMRTGQTNSVSLDAYTRTSAVDRFVRTATKVGIGFDRSIDVEHDPRGRFGFHCFSQRSGTHVGQTCDSHDGSVCSSDRPTTVPDPFVQQVGHVRTRWVRPFFTRKRYGPTSNARPRQKPKPPSEKRLPNGHFGRLGLYDRLFICIKKTRKERLRYSSCDCEPYHGSSFFPRIGHTPCASHHTTRTSHDVGIGVRPNTKPVLVSVQSHEFGGGRLGRWYGYGNVVPMGNEIRRGNRGDARVRGSGNVYRSFVRTRSVGPTGWVCIERLDGPSDTPMPDVWKSAFDVSRTYLLPIDAPNVGSGSHSTNGSRSDPNVSRVFFFG